MPVSPTASWNARAWVRPFWPVVASRTNSVSGSEPGQPPVHDPADLGELVHQVRLRVEPAGRVGDEDVDAARGGRVDGVEDDRGRVGAGGVGDDRHVRPVGPDLELFDGGRAERVRRGEQDRLAPRSR